MRCSTRVFDFPRVFPRVYDTNMLVSKTREKRTKNARKKTEKSKTQAQREKRILYYTMR